MVQNYPPMKFEPLNKTNNGDKKVKITKNFKQTGLLVALSVAIVSAFASSLVNAYGPERTTFTAEKPASYVTFNSITNNPHIGDERNFVRIREAGVGNYVDKIDIQPGKEYEVWTYVHNNASSTLNSKENNYKGIALDVKMKATLPSTIQKGTTARVVSTISASNANPLHVYDEATLTSSSRTVALRYVQGSAVITNNGAVNGQNISGELLFGNGALLGYSSLNGMIPGCTEYSSSVVYKFKADYADFEVSKTVSKNGANNFAKSQSVKAGEKVDFEITYSNTGSINQNNVLVKDLLPTGLSLVPGSVHISTKSDPTGKNLPDELVNKGLNIGNYAHGATATLTFSATVDASKLVCGANTLTNTAQVVTDNGTKSDTANVTVTRDCTSEEKDKCQIVGKTHLEKNDPECAEIPSELPQTGPAEAAAMIIAVIALTSGIAYYMRSRQELKGAKISASGIKEQVSSKIEQIKSKISKK
ncbi:MAG: DUF11 domain-containing protein [bacterium]|nr:DUF11 domain-containing protein [bacterium]